MNGRSSRATPSVLVTYRFDGPVDDIYATLVVRLHHTVAFQSTDLWKSAADFKTQTGTKLGFTLTREAGGFRGTPTAFQSISPGLSEVAGYPGSLPNVGLNPEGVAWGEAQATSYPTPSGLIGIRAGHPG